MIYDLGLGKEFLITDKLDAAFQELDILFNTSNTELICDYEYGVNFENFLWDLTPNEESLKNYIIEKINFNTFILSQMNYSIDVKRMEDDADGFYTIFISIKDDNGKNLKSKVITIR